MTYCSLGKTVAVLLAILAMPAVARARTIPSASADNLEASAQATDYSTPEGGDLRDPHASVDVYLNPPPPDVCCDEEFWGWTVLPKGTIYRSYLAGANEPRMGAQLSYVADNVDDEGFMFDGTLGGRVGLIRWGNRNPFCPQGFQIDVEGAALVRLSFEEEMDVQATDYRVGVPFTYGWGNTQIKFGYWHVSSHIGDEFFIKNPQFDRQNYAKDSLAFGYSHYVTDDLRLYAEASWAFWSDVAEPWEFQFGFDWAPACPTGIHGAPFVATNFHLRQEVEFGGNFVVQAGWAWRSDESSALLRIGLHYFNGKSLERSFFDEFEQQVGLGIWYDY